MKILTYTASLIFIIIIAPACTHEKPDETLPEFTRPLSKTLVFGPEGTGGLILMDEWVDSTGYPANAITIDKPGAFLSAVVSKKGGSNAPATDTIKTTTRLLIDGNEIVQKSFEVAKAIGLKGHNHSGLSYFAGENNVETMVYGFQEPLIFLRNMSLEVFVSDTAVKKLLLTVNYLVEDVGQDEGGHGGDREDPHP